MSRKSCIRFLQHLEGVQREVTFHLHIQLRAMLELVFRGQALSLLIQPTTYQTLSVTERPAVQRFAEQMHKLVGECYPEAGPVRVSSDDLRAPVRGPALPGYRTGKGSADFAVWTSTTHSSTALGSIFWLELVESSCRCLESRHSPSGGACS